MKSRKPDNNDTKAEHNYSYIDEKCLTERQTVEHSAYGLSRMFVTYVQRLNQKSFVKICRYVTSFEGM